MLSKASVIVAAVLLAVAGAAGADEARPAEAGTGETVAWVHLRGGEHVTFRAAGKPFPVRIGTPLVRSDVIEVPSGEFVVVKLRNGYLVKIDEDTTLAVAKIVSLDAPPTRESLASQLDRVLTREERGRAERIAGTQARLAGAESVAPQSASPPPPPAAPPAAAPAASAASSASSSAPRPPGSASRRESAPPAKPLSRGLELEESAVPRESLSDAAGQPSSAPGLGGLGLRGSGPGGGGAGAGALGGLGRIGTRGLGAGSGYGAGAGSAAGGSAASRSTVRIGELEVRGPLDKKLVTLIVKRHQNELRYCHERALLSSPALAGKLVLKVVVGADGAVTAAEAKEALGTSAVGACAAAAARRWQFPPPAKKGQAPGIAIFTVPLHFTAPAP